MLKSVSEYSQVCYSLKNVSMKGILDQINEFHSENCFSCLTVTREYFKKAWVVLYNM
jgi:hypothetical protein